MNNLKPTLLIGLLLLAQFVTAQQTFSYKRGSLQLPNADLKTGSVLMLVTKPDTLDFLYFREGETGYPVRYYADQIISVEIFEGSRRFLSVMLPGAKGMERRIAELHFAGEFFLLSVLEKGGEIYYITDKSGRISILENSYQPPSAENGFKLTYNYEYKSVLSELFRDDIEVQNSIAGLRFRCKDMTNFLKNYHLSKGLPYNQYPPPLANGFAGVTGGASLISNVNPYDKSEILNSFFASAGLFGQFDSYSGPLFFKAGIAAYRGRLYYDTSDNSIFNYVVYREEKIDVSIINLNLNLGFNLFTIGNFRPYISSGIGYYGYTRFRNSIVKETLYIPGDIVFVDLSEEDEKPDSFAGINFEVGTNYNFKSGSRIQLGTSYGHFLNKEGYMKNAITISASYHHKLF